MKNTKKHKFNHSRDYNMNIIQLPQLAHEFLSLAKSAGVNYDVIYSQNQTAVKPTVINGFFIANNTANPSYTQILLAKLAIFRPFMVWLIVQNKPFGEYVQRYLFEPRVRPHRPILGNSLKNQTGVFTMKTELLTHSIQVLQQEYERLNRLHEYDHTKGYADRANAIFCAIHALRMHESAQRVLTTPPTPKTLLGRILGAFSTPAKGGVK